MPSSVSSAMAIVVPGSLWLNQLSATNVLQLVQTAAKLADFWIPGRNMDSIAHVWCGSEVSIFNL